MVVVVEAVEAVELVVVEVEVVEIELLEVVLVDLEVVKVTVAEIRVVEVPVVEIGGGGGKDLGVADDAISSSCTGARTLQTQEGLLACFLKWTNKNRCALNKETKKNKK